MAYAYLSYAAAATALAQRLQDPNLVYFNQPNQLLNCIVESARLYQAMTFSYKAPMSFPTVATQPYYRLAAQAGTVVPYTATDVEVINNVLAALLEPPLIVGWTGTGQFTFAQLQTALQNRLNRFIGETGRQTAQQTIAGIAPNQEFVTLPDGVLDLRRAAFLPTGNAAGNIPLGRQDEWAEQAYLPDYTPGQTVAYSVYGMTQPQVRLIPPTLVAGSLDCIFNQAGVTVNLVPASPVILNIPDDLSAALKWGVLADLLATDGPSRDYARAAYCEQRFSEYVALAQLYASVLSVTIGGNTAGWGSIFDLDFYQPDWQQTTGQPTFLGMAGRELVALGVVPDNIYTVGLIVAANMPVPGNPATTFLQVSRDWLDPILDYAQHIACFQMGGAEFNGTERMYQNMIATAKSQNGRLEAIAFYKSALEQPQRKPEREVERIVRV